MSRLSCARNKQRRDRPVGSRDMAASANGGTSGRNGCGGPANGWSSEAWTLFLLDKLTNRLEIRRVITRNLEEAPHETVPAIRSPGLPGGGRDPGFVGRGASKNPGGHAGHGLCDRRHDLA